MFSLLKQIFLQILLSTTTTVTARVPTPVVVLHGLESSQQKIAPFCDWLTTTFNTTVYNIEIGNGEADSLYMPMHTQLDHLCQAIYRIDALASGFNFIGISQGGLLARGYVEQCNKYPVRNLITLVAPHGGEFIQSIQLDLYTDFLQQHLSVAGYWRNPTLLPTYHKKCHFLPQLNNEIPNAAEKKHAENIRSLQNFALVWSPYDNVLHPPESAKFSFFNELFQIIRMEDTELYKRDWLGLKFLNERDRLHIFQTNCSHVDHRNPVCYAQLQAILKNYI